MVVTLKQLREKGAGKIQLMLFEQTFGEEVTLTKEILLESAGKLDLDWFASKMLTTSTLKAYDEAKATARKAYDEANATALKVYYEANATALEVYYEANATARKVYSEAIATTWKAYDEANATAGKAYSEAKAIALWEVLK